MRATSARIGGEPGEKGHSRLIRGLARRSRLCRGSALNLRGSDKSLPFPSDFSGVWAWSMRKRILISLVLLVTVVLSVTALDKVWSVRWVSVGDTWTAINQMKAIELALGMYHEDYGCFPPASHGLRLLSDVTPRGPYLAPAELIDPWKVPYRYEIPSRGSPVIATLGKDGKPGGMGEDRDLSLEVGTARSNLPSK